MHVFRDRRDAGARLAPALDAYAKRSDVLVLGLPRGGVPVAYEVASGLGAPLDVLVVRKLGVPGHEELAMGAIASGGARVIDRRLMQLAGVDDDRLAQIIDREQDELIRREQLFRGERAPIDVHGRIVILVDDGLATGATMMAAVQALRARDPARIIVAVPVASPDVCDAFRTQVDEIICLVTPEPFYAVGLWYEDFEQTTDAEVRELLERASRDQASREPAAERSYAGA